MIVLKKMVKLVELKVVQLKKELSKLDLSTSGVKTELQLRLRTAMETKGIDLTTHEFENDENSMDNEDQESQLMALDANQLNAALEKFSVNLEVKLSQNVDVIKNRLEDLASNFNGKLTSLEKHVKDVERFMNERIQNIEQHLSVNERTGDSNVSTSNLAASVTFANSDPSRSNNACFKTPVFTGITSFEAFKFQFETVIRRNKWDQDDGLAALILSLQGEASTFLETISNAEKKNYCSLMEALERKYGSSHKRQIHRIELKNRTQQKGESLQDFGAAIERLTFLAYSDTSPDFMEKCKIDAFSDGIQDIDVKRAVVTNPKSTFREVVANAMTHEVASLVCRSDAKVRSLEIADDKGILDLFCQALKTFNRDRQDFGEFKGKCYYCEKVGHFARDCLRRKSDQSENKGSKYEKQRAGEKEKIYSKSKN